MPSVLKIYFTKIFIQFLIIILFLNMIQVYSVSNGEDEDPNGFYLYQQIESDNLNPVWWTGFDGHYRGWGEDAIQTPDDGYLVVGWSDEGATAIKTDSQGNFEWDTKFKLASTAYSCLINKEGDYLLTGGTSRNWNVDSKIWVAKIDPEGNEKWYKTFYQYNYSQSKSIQPTTDGNFILCGSTRLTGNHTTQVIVIKIDGNGNELWMKRYGNDGYQGYSEGKAIQQTTEGGYVIVGDENLDNIGEEYQRDDIWLIKIDQNGNEEWNRSYGFRTSDYGQDVKQTTDGGYIITGGIEGIGDENLMLLKTDSLGNTEWIKTFDTDNDWDMGNSVLQTLEGGYIVAGRNEVDYNVDIWIIKTDHLGNVLWSKTFGGKEYDVALSIKHTKEGGYIISGTTESFGTYDADILLLRIGPNGDASKGSNSFGNSEEKSAKEENNFKLENNIIILSSIIVISIIIVLSIWGLLLYKKIKSPPFRNN